MKANNAVSLNGSRKQPITKILKVDEHYESLQKTDDVRVFYTNETMCKSIVNAIRDIATKKKIKVVSYDVFDTALLRERKSEAGRFWDISEKFVTHCRKGSKTANFTIEDAFLARVTAAKAAYTISPSFAGNREGRFEDIAYTTCDLLGHPKLTESYIANELSYEVGALTANPLVKLVAKALPRTRFIFVSDMYLEGDKITHLLMEKFGPKVAGRVYSSADGFGSKRTGGIFSHIESVLGLAGDGILHIGDSLHSDYKMPRRNGWNSFYLPLPASEKQSRRECHAAVKSRFARSDIALDKYLQFNL